MLASKAGKLLDQSIVTTHCVPTINLKSLLFLKPSFDWLLTPYIIIRFAQITDDQDPEGIISLFGTLLQQPKMTSNQV